MKDFRDYVKEQKSIDHLENVLLEQWESISFLDRVNGLWLVHGRNNMRFMRMEDEFKENGLHDEWKRILKASDEMEAVLEEIVPLEVRKR